MQDGYQSSSASLFATAAREAKPTYTCHFDIPNQKWNVFVIEDGHEFFVQALDTLDQVRKIYGEKVL